MKTSCVKDIVLAIITMTVVCSFPASVQGKDAVLNFIYQSKPDRKLDPAIRGVSIEKPNYLAQNQDDGIMRDFTVRYYDMMLRYMEDRLKTCAPRLKILDRQNIDQRETEVRRDSMGGDLDQSTPVRGAFTADIQIIPRMNINVGVVSIDKKNPKYLLKMIPWIGHHLDIDKYKTIDLMTVTVDCEIKVQSVRTGVIFLSHTYQLVDRRRGYPGAFGSKKKDLAEQKSVQEIAYELVRRQVDEFLGRLFSVRLRYDAVLENASTETCKAVERLNRGDRLDAKMIAWRQVKDEMKDAEAAFITGLIWELDRDYEKAAFWYARALKVKPYNVLYEDSLERVNRVLGKQTQQSGQDLPQLGDDR